MSVTNPSKPPVGYSKAQLSYYGLLTRRLTAFMKQNPEGKFSGDENAYQEFCKKAVSDPSKHGESLYVEAFKYALTLHRLTVLKRLLDGLTEQVKQFNR